MNLLELRKELKECSSKERADSNARFFKTGKGQYGEGDIFLGVTVPNIRKVIKNYSNLFLEDISALLDSKYHEERLAALLILVNKFEVDNNEDIVRFYLKKTKRINNWDLVDLSADKILGKGLFNKDKSILYQLAKSSNLWERRISIISTFYFIKNNSFKDTLDVSKILLKDKHDLIHKAVGWMLREVGKRDELRLKNFIKENISAMSRTTLRYAIEKFSKEERKYFLQL